MSFRAHGNFFQEISSVNEVVHRVKFPKKFYTGGIFQLSLTVLPVWWKIPPLRDALSGASLRSG